MARDGEPRSSPLPLDDLSHALISRLQVDGRAPAAVLARQLGVDQRTVSRRIHSLMEDGVIRISAVTDPRVLGYGSMALVCMSVTGLADSSRVFEDVIAIPQVDYVTFTTGRFAMQAEVVCTDEAELRRVLNESFRRIPEVTSIDVLPYLRLHAQRTWFAGTAHGRELPGIRPGDIDRTDRALVTLLARDGRLTFESLASQLDVSETTVRQRYSSLSRSGAMRVVAIANPLHLGFSATCWVAITSTPSGLLEEIAESLASIIEVSYVAITAGSIDVIAEIVCRTREELVGLMDTKIRPIVGVERAEVWLYLDLEYKPLIPR